MRDVPRSGSRSTSPKGTSTMRMGTARSVVRSSLVFFRASHRASRNTVAYFASSEGCSLMGPNSNQRFSPVFPTPTMSTATRRTTREAVDERRQDLEGVLRHEERRGHRDDPRDREEDLLLRESDKRGVRRPVRRAVDHHDAERHEQERGREEARVEVPELASVHLGPPLGRRRAVPRPATGAGATGLPVPTSGSATPGAGAAAPHRRGAAGSARRSEDTPSSRRARWEPRSRLLLRRSRPEPRRRCSGRRPGRTTRTRRGPHRGGSAPFPSFLPRARRGSSPATRFRAAPPPR